MPTITSASAMNSPRTNLVGALRTDAPVSRNDSRQEDGSSGKDTVTISEEGRSLSKAGQAGKKAQQIPTVDKDESVSDLQDKNTAIRKVNEKIEELKRQAETDESKKQELSRQKVKLDDLNEDVKDIESTLAR